MTNRTNWPLSVWDPPIGPFRPFLSEMQKTCILGWKEIAFVNVRCAETQFCGRNSGEELPT